VTVILSEKGWVRSAKGHEIDPKGLTYKGGDRYLAAVRLRSQQPVVFLDSTGRSYSLPAHTLPSARGQGEPLTGRLAPPDRATFVAALGGDASAKLVLASDAGYGFIVTLEALYAKPKAGKAVLSLPSGARVLPPAQVFSSGSDRLVAITSSGHMLVFPVAELPELARGKGNKIISIPAAKARSREEVVAALAVVYEGGGLMIRAGRRHFTLKSSDLDAYQGERGRRGRMLPRGFQRVETLEVV
jgi:topoisomerase-4 subunit A